MTAATAGQDNGHKYNVGELVIPHGAEGQELSTPRPIAELLPPINGDYFYRLDGENGGLEEWRLRRPGEPWQAATNGNIKVGGNLPQALELAGRGWHVFPCRADKKPYTQHGKDDSTTDPATIRGWFVRWPDALIGVTCDKSGFFAVDIDRKNGIDGGRSWAELVQNHGGGVPVEAGPMQYTPSRGYHLLFKLPADVKIPNNAGVLAPGLDLRSNGYICTGGGYAWLPEHGADSPLTDAPAWLLKRIQDMQKQPRQAPANHDSQPQPVTNSGAYWLRYYLDRASVGNRNEAGFGLACQLRDSGLSLAAADSIMRDYARSVPQAGQNPYTESEALASLESAYKSPRREAAHLPGIAGRNGADYLPQAATSTVPKPTPDSSLILLTELGNSRRFSKTYRGQALHVEAWGWLTWNGRKWENDDTGRVMSLGKKIIDRLFYDAQDALERAKNLAAKVGQAPDSDKESLKAEYDKAMKAANDLMRWAIQSQTSQKIASMTKLAESDMPARVADFDADPWALNCQNGIINLKTGELDSHNPAMRITKIASVGYDPAADCHTWLAFLDRVFNRDKELIAYIQRAVGYSLTGDTSEQCFFFLYGSGRNGKSTFTNAIAALLADYFHKAQSHTFMLKNGQSNGPSEGLAALAGARFVSASELARGQRLDEQTVKDLTGGGDLINARRLYKDAFQYRPALKLWFYGNEKPQVSGTDEGIWRRVRLIPFTVTIPEEEVDPALSEKLAAELPGILAWAVRGGLEWQRQGLGTCAAVKAATEDYRQEEDQIAQWIADCLDVNPNYQAKASELLNSFTAWGGGAMTAKRLASELIRRGYKKARNSRGASYLGLGIPQIDP